MATRYPSTQAVATAWLTSLGFVNVGAVLPADEGSWAADGFVQVTTVGGIPNHDLPEAAPVVSLDFWTTHVGSTKPPWNWATNMAEIARNGTYSAQSRMARLDLDQAGSARVQNAYLLTEPRRIYDQDESGYAHVNADALINWVVV